MAENLRALALYSIVPRMVKNVKNQKTQLISCHVI